MESIADLVVSLRADFGDVAKKTDELSKDIKDLGDAAKSTGKTLEDDLTAQLESLFAKGMTLSEALDAMSPKVEEVGSAAGQAAEQMALFGEEMQIPYADAA